MSKEEIEAIDTLKHFCTDDCCSEYRVVTPILNLIEKQQTRIDELEKALVEEDLKQQTKIKELEDDLYSANCTINDYIEERNKLKDKMIGDKMEQFDDYVIYLIESYLEIMGE